MNSEILDALEASNKSFEQFKGSIESRLTGLETLEAKHNRPHFGGNNTDKIDANNPELKAFNAYLKTGDKHELKAMSVGSNPDGGFAVPKVIDGFIENLLLPQSPIRQLATIRQISTSDYHSLVNTRGTVASWVGETAARPATANSQLVDIAPPMGEMYAEPVASQQMVDDVFFNAGEWLAAEIADSFAESESNQFINGVGVNSPKGILSYPVAATADLARPFGTLQYIPTGAASTFLPLNTSTGVSPLDAFQTMVHSMHPGYRGDAVWLMNSMTLGVLSQLKDSLGRFLVQPSVMSGQPQMLLGYPVVEAMHMPDIAANSFPVAFTNLKRGYLIVDRVGMSVLVDPFSNKPNVQYYARKRLGACVNNSRCIKLMKIATT